jgi:hypothetical protein
MSEGEQRTPSTSEVTEYLQKYGIRASKTLSLLGKNIEFIKAMDSTIGKEILKDDIARHEELLVQMYEETITPKDAAEFRYLKDRLKKISTRIANHDKLVDSIIKSK